MIIEYTGFLILIVYLTIICIFHEAGHFLYAKRKQWNPTAGVDKYGFYVRCDAVGTKKEYVQMSLSGILAGLPIILFIGGIPQTVLIIWYLAACIGDFKIIYKAVLEINKEKRTEKSISAFFRGV